MSAIGELVGRNAPDAHLNYWCKFNYPAIVQAWFNVNLHISVSGQHAHRAEGLTNP